MSDDELEAIKARRLAELQKQRGGNAEQQQQKQEAAAREMEMRNVILSQVLDQNARARLGNILAANESKGRQLEMMIINMARSGRIQGKLSDENFKQLLKEVSDHMPRTGIKVNFDRHRSALDSDSD